MSDRPPRPPDDWGRFDAWLERLLDLSPSQAAAATERLALEDPTLAARLSAALAAAGDRDGLLRGSAAESWPELWPEPAGPADELPGSLRAGDQVGRWRIEGELGHGGMGTVYAVERADGAYAQGAALKLVRLGLDDPALRQRFRRERQILAQLGHPSIARLLDGGVAADGRPYLVLERVDGAPITAWCERRGLDLEARLRLFLDVVAAVEFAHRNLVVHRDLKPSNVLVTEQGEVKLLDFGIAKLLAEDSEAHETVTRVAAPLTPEYAAPEQLAGGTVTTATDVYALGVLLYELVTGKRPYSLGPGSPAELERRILATEPTSPSAVARKEGRPIPTVRAAARDLDAIVLRALANEPEARYASAAHLRQDLERFLAGQPVEARRDSILDRTWRLARRHRLGFAAAVVVLLSLVAAVAGLGAALHQARQRLASAEQARASLDFLVGLFERADPRQARDHTLSAVDLLDRGAETLDADLATQPAARTELTRTLGGVYRSLGLYERARSLLESARDQASARFGAESPQHAVALHELALLEYDVDRYEAAETDLRRAVAIRERSLGARDPATLESLGVLGDVLSAVGRYEEALAIHRSLLAVDRERFGTDHPDSLHDLDSIGMILRRLGRYDESETLLRQVVEARSRLLGPDHPETLNSRMGLANVLCRRSRYAEAEAILLDVVATSERVYGALHPDTASALDSLGGLYRDQGRLAEAIETTRRALAVQVAALGPDASEMAVAKNNLAILAVTAGDFATAEEGFRDALRIWNEALEPGHPHRGAVLANLAFVLTERGREREALALAQESLAIRAAHFGVESAEAAMSWRILALVHLGLDDLAEARQAAETADRLNVAALAADHPRRADSLFVRAEVELAAGRAEDAEPLARSALALRAERLGAAAPKTAEARLLLARTLLARDDLGPALGELEQARAEFDSAFEASSWRHGEVDLVAAEIASARGDQLAAATLLSAARARFEAGRLDDASPIARRANRLAVRLRRG